MYVIYVEVLSSFHASRAMGVAKQLVLMELCDALIAMRMVSFYALHAIGEKEEYIFTAKQYSSYPLLLLAKAEQII